MCVVIVNERVDKHKEKTQLIKQTSENKTRLLMLQKILLKRLSETTGNITENEQFLATLKETKNKAVDITQKLEKAPIATVELDALCLFEVFGEVLLVGLLDGDELLHDLVIVLVLLKALEKIEVCDPLVVAEK